MNRKIQTFKRCLVMQNH